MQWYGAILPRIHRFVPTGSILEIACGYGRWTHFLKDLCRTLSVIDLSEECISACRERFSGCSHIGYHLNDGKSLDMVDDASIDFVFSFDSLVHADQSVLEAYIAQFSRILKPGGAAFIHHSNLGEYHSKFERIRQVPCLETLLTRLGFLDQNYHLRDVGVSAGLVEDLASRYGLSCLSQEIVHWGTKRYQIDCFSVLSLGDAPSDSKSRVFRNPHFMQEAENLSRLARLYAL